CFCFNDAVIPVTYALSLHDALPIWGILPDRARRCGGQRSEHHGERIAVSSDLRRRSLQRCELPGTDGDPLSPAEAGRSIRFVRQDRKSTRLNSSHEWISYAVFCLTK